jgi:predicted dehydrogenase
MKERDETTMGQGDDGTSRRDFLKAATAVAGVVVAGAAAAKPAEAAGEKSLYNGITVPTADAKKLVAGKYPKGTVIAPPSAKGANDRIVLGFIGLGGQGTYGHLTGFVDRGLERNTRVAGVCDAYLPYMDRAKGEIDKRGEKNAGVSVKADKDYRKILELKDIDAVMVATPEHWHGQIAVHAMEAGKHVYCEKPMVRYVDEAFQVYDAAKRTGAVIQVGSQGCTDVRWHAAGKVAREGKLGKLVMGQGSYTRNNRNGEWNYYIPADVTPQNFDWDLWLGSAPKRAWAFLGEGPEGQQGERDDVGARFRRYRKYWDYSAGILGDLMPHKLHPFLIASGKPEFPTRVLSIGTHGVQSKDREVADTTQVIAEFPSGWSMLFVGSTVNEQGIQDMLRGEKATVYFGNNVEVRPERPWSEEVEGFVVDTNAPDLARYARYENIPDHESNWLEAIRRKDPSFCNCNIDLAVKVQTIISLAEASQRLGKAMSFDEKTRKVVAG